MIQNLTKGSKGVFISTIEMALNDPYKHEQKRNYWSTQSCYKFDGKISRRINKMINEFIVSGKRIQL